MDPEIRELIEAACLAADLEAEDHEDWERQRATKQRSGVALHYQTQENALVQKNDAEPTSDAVTRADLDAVLGDFADAIGSELGAINREIIAGLEAKIADLRNQVAVLQSKSGSVTSITRGKRDVA